MVEEGGVDFRGGVGARDGGEPGGVLSEGELSGFPYGPGSGFQEEGAPVGVLRRLYGFEVPISRRPSHHDLARRAGGARGSRGGVVDPTEGRQEGGPPRFR